MRHQFTLTIGGAFADYSHRVQQVVLTTNEHGVESLSADVRMSLQEAFWLYDREGLPQARLSVQSNAIARCRLEDVRIQPGGVSLKALGYWRALSDLPYTALWSSTKIDDWTQGSFLGGDAAKKYTFSTQTGGLECAVTKGATLAAGENGGWSFVIPDSSSRTIVGISFDIVYTLPATCNLILQTQTAGGAFIANDINVAGTGAQVTTTYNLAVGSTTGRFSLVIYNNTGANLTPAGETGATSYRITNMRVVTTTANRVNTTWSSPAGPVTGVQTVTPTSMANIYVGQRLHIKSGGATNAESVIVTAITATTFTATFVGNHIASEPIQAHVVYSDEIAKDIVAAITATNSGQLSSSTALIQSPVLDLADQRFEDADMADALTTLAALGDNQARRWEVGVNADQLCYFRPRGYDARTWIVDIADLEIERTIESLANSVYAVYQDANGRALRTAASADASGVSRYGVTRQAALSADTTSSTEATSRRNTALADGKDPAPRSRIVIRSLYDGNGARRLLWEPQPGDTIIVRNLPPNFSTNIDRIRRFRIVRTEYAIDDRELQVEPEEPLPQLEFILARQAIGVR